MSHLQVKLIYHTPLEPFIEVYGKKGLSFSPTKLLDHIFYMFEIEGCSRVTSHQLVRHRVASYDQESQRFSAAIREECVIPPSIQSNAEALRIFNSSINQAYLAFDKLTSLGIPKEDARYLLPSALRTKLVMTVSAKSLMHIIKLRTAIQAQWEIRELVIKMYELAKKSTPELWSVTRLK